MIALGALAGVALIASSVALPQSEAAVTAQAGSPPGAASAPGAFVRRVESAEGELTLEVASRRYTREGGPGSISLVGVVHIGSPGYYEALQRHLDAHATVLYESVAPRGAMVDVAQDPVEATRDRMLFLRRVMLSLRDADRAAGRTDHAPTIADALARAHAVDSRFAPWAVAAASDAWGRALEVEVKEDGSFLLISRGADGLPGGSGADGDIRLRTPADRRAVDDPAEALQPQLAGALGLAFQLDAIDYHRPSWLVADMGERQLLAEFAERGVDAGPFLGALSGSNMTATLASASFALLRIADGLSGGRVRAFIVLMLIETLASADDRLLAQGLPPGFAEVILHRRNEVAWSLLNASQQGDAPPASVALFYGAAHMPDLERRLAAAGWSLASEQWFPAFSIDPARAGLDESTTEQFRSALREMLDSMRTAEERP